MSVHARAKLFFIRPTSLVRLATRNAPATRRMHAMALSVRAPSRLHGANRSTHVVAIGALLSAGVAALARDTALCEQVDAIFAKMSDGASGGKKGGRDSSAKSEIDKLMDEVLNHCGDISLGTALGFCSGYALKQVGKVAAITVGTLFVLAQVASSQGYIQINWRKVEKDVIEAVDPDGDGKITKKDLEIWYRRLMAVLQTNLPSSAGFAGGFMLGAST